MLSPFACEFSWAETHCWVTRKQGLREGSADLPKVLQNVPDGGPIGVPEHKPPTCHLSLNAKQLQLLPQLPMISASLKDCCAHVQLAFY